MHVPTPRERAIRKQEQIDRADIQRGINKVPEAKKTKKTRVPTAREQSVRKQEHPVGALRNWGCG